MESKIESAIIDTNETIMRIKDDIKFCEDLMEFTTETKKIELNIAFLKNALKFQQMTLIGLRGGGNDSRLNTLILEKIKEIIRERQEIIEEVSENGLANDDLYNKHCLHHRDLFRIIDS